MTKSKYYMHNGKRYVARGKTMEEAEQKKKARLAILSLSKYDENITVKAWSKIWLDVFIAPTVSYGVLKDYQYRINNFLIPSVGGLPVRFVRKTNCQSVINAMSNYSNDRVSKVRSATKRLFADAVDENIISVNPADRLAMPVTEEDGEGRAITDFERDATLKVVPIHHAGGWILTMLYTGLRPGEIAALKGKHVDTTSMFINVEQALKRDGHIGAPKSKAGIRKVPFPETLLEYIGKTKKDDYVFLSRGGTKLTSQQMNRLWRNFKSNMQLAAGAATYRNKVVARLDDDTPDKTGLMPLPIADDLVPYCYRHTFATDCVQAGVTIETLQKLMGHKSITVTQRYFHITDARLEQTAELLNAYRST